MKLKNCRFWFTFSLTPDSLKNFKSLSSRSVRRQNIECSNGVIFLMATFRPLGWWTAEQTIPYAPSPMTVETLYWVPVIEVNKRPRPSGNAIVHTDIEPNLTRLGSGGSVTMAFARLSLLRLVLLSYGNGWVGHCKRRWWWCRVKWGWWLKGRNSTGKDNKGDHNIRFAIFGTLFLVYVLHFPIILAFLWRPVLVLVVTTPSLSHTNPHVSVRFPLNLGWSEPVPFNRFSHEKQLKDIIADNVYSNPSDITLQVWNLPATLICQLEHAVV